MCRFYRATRFLHLPERIFRVLFFSTRPGVSLSLCVRPVALILRAPFWLLFLWANGLSQWSRPFCLWFPFLPAAGPFPFRQTSDKRSPKWPFVFGSPPIHFRFLPPWFLTLPSPAFRLVHQLLELEASCLAVMFLFPSHRAFWFSCSVSLVSPLFRLPADCLHTPEHHPPPPYFSVSCPPTFSPVMGHPPPSFTRRRFRCVPWLAPSPTFFLIFFSATQAEPGVTSFPNGVALGSLYRVPCGPLFVLPRFFSPAFSRIRFFFPPPLGVFAVVPVAAKPRSIPVLHKVVSILSPPFVEFFFLAV